MNAYNYILTKILDGEIKQGERIREDIIAEQMGTSRTPVREAMNQLSQNGFIINIPRKGLYCVEITQDELLNLLELRTVLSDFSYQKCVQTATTDDIKKLYEHINLFRALSQKDKIQRHEDFDIRFHLMIAEITKSPRLIKYIQEIETILRIARANLKKSPKMNEVIDMSWVLHQEIVQAIEEKNIILLRDINDRHMKLMRETQVLVKG